MSPISRAPWAATSAALLAAAALLSAPSTAGAQQAPDGLGPFELEGFVITGTPVPRSATVVGSYVSILDGAELRTLGVTRVVDALRVVPGLAVVQSGSFGGQTSVFFRGSESDHTKVLIDGVAVNQAGGAYDYSGLTMANVERIEVVRGPASALYGTDAMAGVINVITRRGAGDASGSVSISGGTYGRLDWQADLHGGSESTSYALSLSELTTDGIYDFNNRHENTVLEGSLQHRADERTWLSFSGRYSDRSYGFPTNSAGEQVDENQFTYGSETTLNAQVNRLLGDRVQLSALAALYQWNGGTDDQPDSPADTLGFYQFTSLDNFRRAAAEIRGNVDLGASSVLSLGIELENEDQRSFSEYASSFGPGGDQTTYDRTNVGYYAHALGEWAALSGNAGLRVEDNEQYGTFVTYQLGAGYRFARTGTRVRGTLGTGLKEPTFFEAFAQGFTRGNPDLQPEKSLVWDLGVEQTFGSSGATASVSWFDQTLEDLIQYTGVPANPGDPNFYNVAKASARGIETEALLPIRDFFVGAGYTWLKTEVLDSGFDEGEGAVFVEGQPLIRRPEHTFTAEVGWRHDRGSVSTDLRYVGARSDRDFTTFPASPVELAAYVMWNAAADVRLTEAQGGRPGFTLRVGVENIADEVYEEVYGFRTPGRALMVGGRVDFGVSSPW
jgi:vitamin B12 transporter